MSNFLKAIGAFVAFFCLILGGWMVLRGENIMVGAIGAVFAASGATFFFVFFLKQ